MQKIDRYILFFILLLLVLAFHNAKAQEPVSYYDYPHHHLPWYTLESEHFLVHFQEGNSRSAQVASRVAEEVYPHITSLYGTEPDSKTSIVLKDREDYANGAAYFFDNQIEIWVTSLDSPFRGTHEWMRNVISHEFIHIVQLKASMKKNRQLPAIYFQWLSYEGVRRPDVLYGYPNGLLTYPFSSISVPGWFAEGTAQYQRTGWTYDTWDSHRDMILRTAVLNDTYLSFEEMGTFTSKNSLEREQVYNQGFAFSSYLALKHGEKVFSEISHTLAEPGFYNIDNAIEQVTGQSGHQLFEEWITDRRAFYSTAVQDIKPDETRLIEPDGFLNLYPIFSPDGGMIAYLSNKNRTESGLSLYIKELGEESGKSAKILDSIPVDHAFTFSCGFQKEPLISRIRSAFSFDPEGERIVFTRTDLNKFGEEYNDLFTYHFQSEEIEQLTRSARIHDPEWSPEGNRIAALQADSGTVNLVLVDPSDGSILQLTSYTDGEQLFTPFWHPDGDTIYYSFSEDNGRSIRKISLPDNRTDIILRKPYIDFRDPFIDREGLFLYYSADPDGIFNIYRIPVGGGIEEEEQLTSVIGGAFMPNLNDENRLVYAEYKKGGYKIVSKSLPQTNVKNHEETYMPPLEERFINAEHFNGSEISDFDDSDLDPFHRGFIARADTGKIAFQIPTAGASNDRQLYSYNQEFTKFSFYPVIRFDNYSKFYGSNSSLLKAGNFGKLGGNLLRDMKLGTYFTSRDVTNRLNIFGGALIGFGSRSAEGINDFFQPSRLTDLDRDLFLIMEYRGLPFIEKRWSPTLSVELYNLRRNVDGGLAVEEFPCTACLPDTTNVDIAYNIWEVDLFLRNKINAFSLVELGIGYTPYRVQTDGFVSRELRQPIPSTSTEYFRGSTFSAAYIYEKFNYYPHMDTAPIGMRAMLKYTYQPSELLENFEIQEGTLSPVYKTSQNHSVEFSSRLGFGLGDNTTGQIYSRFFNYFNKPDDSFYLDYIGGFTGMRSYPFFALGGNTTALAQFSYIFPIITDMNNQIGRHTFDKLFLRLFGEAGNGWNGPLEIGNNLKTGIGAELRFAFNSYYLYPLKFFISGSYGFNEFDVNLSSEYITETGSNRVTYGREMLFHFGLTFDFEILNND